MVDPVIIQGGMGIGISGWPLAKAVSKQGQLGVVSGTSLDNSFIRRLQDGDPQGCLRRAMRHFPVPQMASQIEDAFFISGGKASHRPYLRAPMFTHRPSRWLQQITVLANFVEIWLAKENHHGLIGINLLEKVQLPNLASLYGAMLAGVDVVLMGAGIPKEIPLALDCLALHQKASLNLQVAGAERGDKWVIEFDPCLVIGKLTGELRRPRFLAIVASTALARFMSRVKSGRVDGLILEGPTAGGHNAPPRGNVSYNDRGEPLYGLKDRVDLKQVSELGLPFWLAGSWCSPEKVDRALKLGAAGVQVGSAFAFCSESGMHSKLKYAILEKAMQGGVEVFTDPLASPTGFPFKVARMPDTLSEESEYKNRKRVCDLRYLREMYRKPNGQLGYRCASEPMDAYLRKGGKVEATRGRKCLCNALMSSINLPQVRPWGAMELPLQTTGDGINELARRFCRNGLSYCVRDVLAYLLDTHEFQSRENGVVVEQDVRIKSEPIEEVLRCASSN